MFCLMEVVWSHFLCLCLFIIREQGGRDLLASLLFLQVRSAQLLCWESFQMLQQTHFLKCHDCLYAVCIYVQGLRTSPVWMWTPGEQQWRPGDCRGPPLGTPEGTHRERAAQLASHPSVTAMVGAASVLWRGGGRIGWEERRIDGEVFWLTFLVSRLLPMSLGKLMMSSTASEEAELNLAGSCWAFRKWKSVITFSARYNNSTTTWQTTDLHIWKYSQLPVCEVHQDKPNEVKYMSHKMFLNDNAQWNYFSDDVLSKKKQSLCQTGTCWNVPYPILGNFSSDRNGLDKMIEARQRVFFFWKQLPAAGNKSGIWSLCKTKRKKYAKNLLYGCRLSLHYLCTLLHSPHLLFDLFLYRNLE